MSHQLILVVVVFLCIVSKTSRAFVAADDESIIPEFGECFTGKYIHKLKIYIEFIELETSSLHGASSFLQIF